ncbi:hypothetical protein AB0D14_09745 [Streptomyces sp. NPDC048484]|uniref:hypothetical protein n=1 Tax=Streptomyces sp. NPDC048484 TaxID=3155146 RepID=UPI00344569DF
MTPWLRTLRVTGLLLLLLAGPAYSPYAAAYEPVPAQSRAGSRAGEGRERPGREAAPTDEDSPSAHSAGSSAGSSASPEGQDASVAPEASRSPSTPPTPPEAPARPVDAHGAADRPVRASEPVLLVLPLGSGLVLIGLGLGLAFLALRVRRS